MIEPAVMITWAGSHRQQRNHVQAFKRLGIPWKDAYPVSLNSKRRKAIIPVRCLDAALSIQGVNRSREQWDYVTEHGHDFG